MKIFLSRSAWIDIHFEEKESFMADFEELKKNVGTLRELADDWQDNAAVLNQLFQNDQDLKESLDRLRRENNQGNLIKLGLTLIAFPFPIVVDDVLGWSFLAAGLIQKKIKNSALYLEDVDGVFSEFLKELHKVSKETL